MRALKALLPTDVPAPVIVSNDEDQNAGHIVTISGVSVAVLPMPFAIPMETTARAILNEFVWTDARLAFAKAKGHVLLSILNPDVDPALQLSNARILTVVTAAVLSTAKGLGVYWQSSDSVLAPSRFAQESKLCLRDEVAPELWFSLRFFPGSDDPNSDQIVCQSTGLSAFLGREIECGPYSMTPAEIANTVIVAARFMATSGPVFAEGHTLGFSGSEEPDAQLFLDWSALGGTNKPIFQLRLLSQEKR